MATSAKAADRAKLLLHLVSETVCHLLFYNQWRF